MSGSNLEQRKRYLKSCVNEQDWKGVVLEFRAEEH